MFPLYLVYPEREERSAARLRRPMSVLDTVSLLVPRRLADEEIGDALEEIYRLVREDRPQLKVWLKVCSTVFWIGINSLREIVASLLGRKVGT